MEQLGVQLSFDKLEQRT